MKKYFFVFKLLLLSSNINCAESAKEQREVELREVLVVAAPPVLAEAPPAVAMLRSRHNGEKVAIEIAGLREEMGKIRGAIPDGNDFLGKALLQQVFNMSLVVFALGMAKCCFMPGK